MKDRFQRLVLSEEQIKETEAYYEKYHRENIPEISYEDFTEFSRTGIRLNYENKYFERRHRINGTFMMMKIHGGRYVNELCGLLLAVCAERSWALPAHIRDMENPGCEIDLFAAETAMMLTEIMYLAGTKLPGDVKERLAIEINRRVTEPFLNGSFAWEKAEHNWSAVCAGAIGITLLHSDLNRLPLTRILKAMDAYLLGYAEDGVCLEGAGYWSYGFGFYMFFAAELLRIRGIDIMHTEKVRKIAEFYQSLPLSKSACISCSDAAAKLSVPEGLVGMISEYFDISPREGTDVEITDDCGRWAHFIRSYLYAPPEKETLKTGETVFSNSQWYINRQEKYSFFIKGGHNAEPHNHNDVGSFIIADDSGQLLCDIGAGEYTRGYFDDKTRYDYLCCSSLGHSVPIIDGKGQLNGESYRCSSFECGNNRAELEIGGAYGIDARVVRTAELSEDKITLRDSFGFGDKKPRIIYERFISTAKPEETADGILIRGLKMNKIGKIHRETINGHDGKELDVYIIDIEAENEFEITFEFA